MDSMDLVGYLKNSRIVHGYPSLSLDSPHFNKKRQNLQISFLSMLRPPRFARPSQPSDIASRYTRSSGFCADARQTAGGCTATCCCWDENYHSSRLGIDEQGNVNRKNWRARKSSELTSKEKLTERKINRGIDEQGKVIRKKNSASKEKLTKRRFERIESSR